MIILLFGQVTRLSCIFFLPHCDVFSYWWELVCYGHLDLPGYCCNCSRGWGMIFSSLSLSLLSLSNTLTHPLFSLRSLAWAVTASSKMLYHIPASLSYISSLALLAITTSNWSLTFEKLMTNLWQYLITYTYLTLRCVCVCVCHAVIWYMFGVEEGIKRKEPYNRGRERDEVKAAKAAGS